MDGLEYFLIHQNRYRFILKKITQLNLPKQAKILDIGCYPPHLFLNLKELGYKVYGICSRHEKVNLKDVTSLNIETDKFPFRDSFFDLVLLTEVMEHLIIDPGIYLEKIKRVLKPSGTLLITTPNASFLGKRLKTLVGLSANFSLDELFNTKSIDQIYMRHNREFTKKELEEILKRSGFTNIHCKYFSSYSPFRKKLSPESALVKILKIAAFFFISIIAPFKDSIFALSSKT